MTGAQFRKCVTAIRWSQVQIAEDLGVLPAKVRKWSAGADTVPPEVAAWVMSLAK
jgi:DNA-binding transcriptional regulator YdaS (Cro superfamily)